MELARPAAGEDDLERCAELLAQALAGAAHMRGGGALVGATTVGQLLARWVPSTPAVALLVGEFHQAVVGVAAAVTFTRPEATTLSARIECCYVEEGARGVGVGTALMDALVAWCIERGCSDIDALALPGDRASKQRLEASGFTARLLTLNRRLG
jgi:GNAT superfamily N-acetyltransferase